MDVLWPLWVKLQLGEMSEFDAMECLPRKIRNMDPWDWFLDINISWEIWYPFLHFLCIGQQKNMGKSEKNTHPMDIWYFMIYQMLHGLGHCQLRRNPIFNTGLTWRTLGESREGLGFVKYDIQQIWNESFNAWTKWWVKQKGKQPLVFSLLGNPKLFKHWDHFPICNLKHFFLMVYFGYLFFFLKEFKDTSLQVELIVCVCFFKTYPQNWNWKLSSHGTHQG